MKYQKLELEDILNLNKDELDIVKSEVQRVLSMTDSLIKVGKDSLGALNILKKAGYEYNLGIDSNPFFVEHLFSIVLSKLTKLNIYTNKAGVITEIELV